jgi:hypothetical protein
MLLFHESEDEARAAAIVLRGLGGHARRLLEECVEQQELTRKKASAAARSLENAGFVFVRETSDLYDPSFIITPSLAGEEALEALVAFPTTESA